MLQSGESIFIIQEKAARRCSQGYPMKYVIILREKNIALGACHCSPSASSVDGQDQWPTKSAGSAGVTAGGCDKQKSRTLGEPCRLGCVPHKGRSASSSRSTGTAGAVNR